MSAPRNAAAVEVHRLARTISHAKHAPVTNAALREALRRVAAVGPAVMSQEYARELIIGAQSLIGARYLAHLFPEIAEISYTIERAPHDATCSHAGHHLNVTCTYVDSDGQPLAFNPEEVALIDQTVVQHLWAQATVGPLIGESANSQTVQVGLLYSEHVDPETTWDEVYGLDALPGLWDESDVLEACENPDLALRMMQEVGRRKIVNTVPDAVVSCAISGLLAQFNYEGDPGVIDQLVNIAMVKFARTVKALALPEGAEAAVVWCETGDGGGQWGVSLLDGDDDPLEIAEDLEERLDLAARDLAPVLEAAVRNGSVTRPGVTVALDQLDMLVSAYPPPAP